MEYNKAVADMLPGMEIEGYYVLSSASVKLTSAGKPYMNAVIGDASGNIEAKLWDYSGSIRPEDNGAIVKIRASVGEFKGASQLTIKQFRFADERDENNYALSDLVPSAPIDPDGVLSEIRELIVSMDDPDYRRVASAMLEKHMDSFMTMPAAKSFHHSFLSGLLMHTGSMLRAADFLACQYSEVIDRSLLLCGALCHDLAKDKEFVLSRLGLVTDYSVKGDLLGHPVMGAMEIAQMAAELDIPEEKAMLLQHMILSHHGQPEYGAAVMPQCAEAELLSIIDLMDARMELYAETLANVPAGSFSSKVFALDKKIYKHN